MNTSRKCLAVIRIRGTSDVRSDVQETLKMLNIAHNCNATLIDNRPSYLGMLQKAQSYITWGEPSKEMIALLLKKRGRTFGNRRLTDKDAQKAGYDSLDSLAEAICDAKIQLNGVSEIKPFFRLHPPRKGYKGTVKKAYKAGGATGYREEDAINNLLKRMT